MDKIQCPHCEKFYSVTGIGTHMKMKHNSSFKEYARLNNLQTRKITEQKNIVELINSNEKCSYGCGLNANFQLKNGKFCCSKNINSCEGMKRKNSSGVKDNIEKYPKDYSNRISPFTKEENRYNWTGKSLTESHKNNISKSLTGNIKMMGSNNGMSKMESKEKLRNIMLKKYSNGFEVKCGRAPKISYESPIAGKIKVDGTWELKVAQYLDGLKVNWVRNKERFEYINELNKYSTYCPDFYIQDWDCYIEVKGYKTKKDSCKWEQFPKNKKLLIWDKQKLLDLFIL